MHIKDGVNDKKRHDLGEHYPCEVVIRKRNPFRAQSDFHPHHTGKMSGNQCYITVRQTCCIFRQL